MRTTSTSNLPNKKKVTSDSDNSLHPVISFELKKVDPDDKEETKEHVEEGVDQRRSSASWQTQMCMFLGRSSHRIYILDFTMSIQ